MRMQTITITFLSLFIFISSAFSAELTEKDVKDLVEKASKLILEKGEAALAEISKEDGGFYFKERGLYAFVYSEECVMLAHPYKPNLIGKSYKGKPDIKGKKFRDEIVEKALKEGAGWTDYTYQKPGDQGLFQKTAYGKLVEKDGKKYIVVSGMYKPKENK